MIKFIFKVKIFLITLIELFCKIILITSTWDFFIKLSIWSIIYYHWSLGTWSWGDYWGFSLQKIKLKRTFLNDYRSLIFIFWNNLVKNIFLCIFLLVVSGLLLSIWFVKISKIKWRKLNIFPILCSLLVLSQHVFCPVLLNCFCSKVLSKQPDFHFILCLNFCHYSLSLLLIMKLLKFNFRLDVRTIIIWRNFPRKMRLFLFILFNFLHFMNSIRNRKHYVQMLFMLSCFIAIKRILFIMFWLI